MFWALKNSGKKKQSTASETMNFEFPINVLYAYSLQVEADVVCHKSNVKQFYSLRTVKRMLYLGSIFLRYVLIYNLEVYLNVITFLQHWLTVIKMQN